VYDTHLTYRNSLHCSPSDPNPHITITLLSQENIDAAKSGQPFKGVNVHLYICGPSPERLYDPLGLHKEPNELLAQGIAELQGFNVFRWAVVRQGSNHALALTGSIQVEWPRGIRQQAQTLIARGPTLKWKWVALLAPLEIVDVTGKYDFQQHKHQMESLRFQWKKGQIPVSNLVQMDPPGSVAKADIAIYHPFWPLPIESDLTHSRVYLHIARRS
jgi:hypothetical protein